MGDKYQDNTKRTEKAATLSGKMSFKSFKLMVLRHFASEHYLPYEETDEINYNIRLMGGMVLQTPEKKSKKPKKK